VQRCPEWLPTQHEPWLRDPQRIQILHHPNGLAVSPALGNTYRNQVRHDPSDLNRAREIASASDCIPVGVLYRNPDVPCYEDLRHQPGPRTPDAIRRGLEAEFERFTV